MTIEGPDIWQNCPAGCVAWISDTFSLASSFTGDEIVTLIQGHNLSLSDFPIQIDQETHHDQVIKVDGQTQAEWHFHYRVYLSYKIGVVGGVTFYAYDQSCGIQEVTPDLDCPE